MLGSDSKAKCHRALDRQRRPVIGDGPYYVYVTVRVVGYDEFDLDRDGDGLGCE